MTFVTNDFSKKWNYEASLKVNKYSNSARVHPAPLPLGAHTVTEIVTIKLSSITAAAPANDFFAKVQPLKRSSAIANPDFDTFVVKIL